MSDSISADRIRRWPFRLLLLLVFGIGALAVAWGSGVLFTPEPGADFRHRTTALWMGLALAAAAVVALWLQRRAEPSFQRATAALAESVDSLTFGRRAWELVAVSLLGLFLEVLLIRWHGTELRVAAYFKNITLLAAFLGLGLGFAAANRRRLILLTTPVALAAQVIVLSVMDARGADEVLRNPVSANEWVWGVAQAEWDWTQPWRGWDWDSVSRQSRFWIQAGVFYGFFAALFVSTILIFMPIGQLTGRLMTGFSPIRAYTLNIFGSLAGVVLFGLVSYLWLPPVAWFGLAGMLLVFLLRHERGGAALGGVALLATLVATGLEGGGQTLNIYSPYQRLEVAREYIRNERGEQLDTGVLVSANKAYHLRTANLDPEFVPAHADEFPRLREMAAAYDLPYHLTGKPNRVLVVGAGGGNDVAAALRNGANHVDAVEIDPAILDVGRRYHAEQPYASDRASVHVNDARAFMRRAPDAAYDLIVFGLLDSHTLLSGMSAVRLDNFVYTLESMREARRLLKPGGTVALSFATGEGGYVTTRLHNMLAEAFGSPPEAFKLGYDDGMMFVARAPAASTQASIAAGSTAPSPQLGQPGGADTQQVSAVGGANEAHRAKVESRRTQVERQLNVAPATDDWPFLYLQGHRWDQVPRSYLVMIVILAAISIVWVVAGSGRRTGISPHFFFLGGAFLLIEVKGITELALIYGTTWIVSSVVIAAILVLILLANLFVTGFPDQNRTIHYAALAACLLAGYFLRLEWLLGYGWWVAALAATTLLVLPLFFAGVIFAASLKQAAGLPRVFSSNLLGAILGGLCEYSAMAIGFRNLYLVGLALYALSFLTMPRRGPAEEQEIHALRPQPEPGPLVAAAGERA